VTSLGRLTAQLHTAARNVPGEELRSAQDAVERLGAAFHEATDTSHNDDVTGVLTDLRQASEHLSAALSRAQQIVNALAAFTNHAGLPPIRRTLPGSAHVAVPGRSASGQPPQQVHDAGRSLPLRTGRQDPTTGVFNGETIVSGRDRASVTGLRPDPRGAWPEVLLVHVESHVAARMRREKLTDGEVTLNNVTCGNRGYDNDWPETCAKYLRSILPKNARLTVWATTDGAETWWTKTYVGTGERIAS
jgi:hypothetical protein